jgi:hypothetical protein
MNCALFPGLLVLFFALAAYGPWSVAEVTGRSQARQLEAILTEKGMLADGKWLGRDALALPFRDRVRLASMLGELEGVQQLHRLKPWFEGVPGSPSFSDPPEVRRWLNNRLNLDTYSPAPVGFSERQAALAFETPRPRVFKMTAAGYLVGPINRYSRYPYAADNPVSSPTGSLTVSMEASAIQVRGPDGHSVKFDLTPLFLEIEASPKSVRPLFERRLTLTEPEMRLLDGEGNFKAKAAIAEATVNPTGTWAEFFLILPASP